MGASRVTLPLCCRFDTAVIRLRRHVPPHRLRRDQSEMSDRTSAIERLLVWACVIAALLGVVPGLRLLRLIWNHIDYLGHGYLIPVASALLAYSRRAEILAALRSGPVPVMGPVWVLLAALFETAAVAGEVVTAAGVGIPLLLLATAYAVGGRPLVRAAGLPIAFLILMVPLPSIVENRLLVDLKAMVVFASVGALQSLGYTVVTSGNVILVPGYELFVSDACSGLTSIATLLPLSVVVAYFVSHGVWRRLAIVASLVPFAILGNMVRITITTVLVASGRIEYSEGLLHETLGITTFVMGTLALTLLAKALR